LITIDSLERNLKLQTQKNEFLMKQLSGLLKRQKDIESTNQVLEMKLKAAEDARGELTVHVSKILDSPFICPSYSGLKKKMFRLRRN
jgi:hypothetical protein